MKAVGLSTCLGAFLALCAPALAQSALPIEGTGAAGLRCSQLQGMQAPAAAAMVYYIAGYDDALRDAMAMALGGTLEGAAAGAGAETIGQQAGAPARGGAPPTLTLAADQVIAACAQSPDSRIVDIITSQGGSGMAEMRTPNATDTAPATTGQ